MAPYMYIDHILDCVQFLIIIEGDADIHVKANIGLTGIISEALARTLYKCHEPMIQHIYLFTNEAE